MEIKGLFPHSQFSEFDGYKELAADIIESALLILKTSCPPDPHKRGNWLQDRAQARNFLRGNMYPYLELLKVDQEEVTLTIHTLVDQLEKEYPDD